MVSVNFLMLSGRILIMAFGLLGASAGFCPSNVTDGNEALEQGSANIFGVLSGAFQVTVEFAIRLHADGITREVLGLSGKGA